MTYRGVAKIGIHITDALKNILNYSIIVIYFMCLDMEFIIALDLQHKIMHRHQMHYRRLSKKGLRWVE